MRFREEANNNQILKSNSVFLINNIHIQISFNNFDLVLVSNRSVFNRNRKEKIQ